MQDEIFILVDRAVEGDRHALEEVLLSVQDMVYNLSLRMLGTPCDAEDASQEILIKVMTQLSSFRKESAFSTWVYRIATNYLINCKKSLFAKRPLSFEFYGADIDKGFVPNTPELIKDVDEELLLAELKQSCTNVMLQCLDSESRLIFVLGVMFRMDSRVCGEILDLSPEAYRQRLSRIKKQVGGFLREYCGLSKSGKCNCKKRLGYAVLTHRLNPENLEYSKLQVYDKEMVDSYTDAMEEMDELSLVFAELPRYRSPENVKSFANRLLNSEKMDIIRGNA